MKIDLNAREMQNLSYLLRKQRHQLDESRTLHDIGSASYHLISKSIVEIDETIKKLMWVGGE